MAEPWSIAIVVIAAFCVLALLLGATRQPRIVPRAQAPTLRCLSGPWPGRRLALRKARTVIGRNTDTDLCIPGKLVSRYHAEIVWNNNSLILYDRESTNGTWVNNQRVAVQTLQPGDQIRIGPVLFLLEGSAPLADAPPSRTAVSAPLPPKVQTPPPTPTESAVIRQVRDLADYQLDRIAEGGTAIVYRAVSRIDGSVIAVKVLKTTDPYFRDKFRQQGRELRSLLHHPHIIEIYEFDQTPEGQPYILMEYADRGSLRERLRRGDLLLPEVVQIIGETCDALDYAHRKGVIHRDVKPDNILFSSTGGVKLADFGIARLAGMRTMTSDGMIIGTPYYLSYEQARGLPSTVQSDIYSLGVVLYEMLTGRVPFGGESLHVVEKHISEQPVPPTHLNRSIPPPVEAVVLRALAKDARQRFQTPEQMARALGYDRPFFRGDLAIHLPHALVSAAAKQAAVPKGGVSQLVNVRTGQIIRLANAVTVLNRNLVNQADMMISRQHARVIRRDHNSWLEDQGSINGTYLNRVRIFEPTLLEPGDEIIVGATVLRAAS